MTNYRKTYFDNNKSNHGWYTCVGCGTKLRKSDAEVDHIVPLAHDGSNDEDNLQCMCRKCNASKGKSMEHSIDDYLWKQIGYHPGHDVDNMINQAADELANKKFNLKKLFNK